MQSTQSKQTDLSPGLSEIPISQVKLKASKEKLNWMKELHWWLSSVTEMLFPRRTYGMLPNSKFKDPGSMQQDPSSRCHQNVWTNQNF